jgi:UDP-N-acetylglucosamine 4,6-dehydratase
MAESLFLTANDPQYGPRFSVVRYGNVAGSTGSVIPTWRAAIARAGKAVKVTTRTARASGWTREEAAKLVVDTLVSMKGGELAIPDLPAFRLGDLAEAMDAVRHEVTRLGAGRSCTSRWTRRGRARPRRGDGG